jgi:hypothetical protein
MILKNQVHLVEDKKTKEQFAVKGFSKEFIRMRNKGKVPFEILFEFRGRGLAAGPSERNRVPDGAGSPQYPQSLPNLRES